MSDAGAVKIVKNGDKPPIYVSRTGSAERMALCEAELIRKNYQCVTAGPGGELGAKQYRRRELAPNESFLDADARMILTWREDQE